MTDPSSTSLENARWVYTALAHAHISVDVLSERQLAEQSLSNYKVIYVLGTNLRRDVCDQLQAWMEHGGVVWIDALGMRRDEANQPLEAMARLLGNKRSLETWGTARAYHATELPPLSELMPPRFATVSWKAESPWGNGIISAAIGRETLGGPGEVIARFADNKSAVVRGKVGKGALVVVGLIAGLTYSARVRRDDYDMT